MPQTIQGELYAKPQPAGAAVTAWQTLANRITAEANEAGNGVEAARRGGSEFSGQAAGVASDGDKIVDAISGAMPGPEIGLLADASGNGAGVGNELDRAVGKAGDPDTYPGAVDFDAANREAGFSADGIHRDAGNLRGYPEPPDRGGGGGGGKV